MFLAVEFNRQIFSITHGIRRVESACGINKETGAGDLAVLIGPANLYDSLGGLVENVFNFAADRARRGTLGPGQKSEGKKRDRERKPGHRRAKRPGNPRT